MFEFFFKLPFMMGAIMGISGIGLLLTKIQFPLASTPLSDAIAQIQFPPDWFGNFGLFTLITIVFTFYLYQLRD